MACVGALTGLGFWGMENSSEMMLLMLMIHLMLLMTGVGTLTEEGFKGRRNWQFPSPGW